MNAALSYALYVEWDHIYHVTSGVYMPAHKTHISKSGIQGVTYTFSISSIYVHIFITCCLINFLHPCLLIWLIVSIIF